MFFTYRKNVQGRGSSVVVVVMALPLLLIFLCALVDLGRVAYLGAETNAAAHAIRRQAVAQAAPCTESEASHLAFGASPALHAEGLGLNTQLKVGKVQKREYVRKVFDSATGKLQELPAVVSTQSFQVTLTLTGAYITPLGALFALSNNGTNTFICTAYAEGDLDISPKEARQ